MIANDRQEQMKLTDGQRKALTMVLDRGPGSFVPNSAGKAPAHIEKLIDMGYLERLNRLRPGPSVYEITAAGRAALRSPR